MASPAAGQQPEVDTVKPNAGPVAGGTKVTIIGTNFVGGGTSVKFGTVASPSVQFESPMMLSATVPAQAAGVVDVTVLTPGGTSATSPGDLYAYGPPTITSVSPTGGSAAGGTTVTIAGTNFVPRASVSFGATQSLGPVNFISSTQITAVAPAHVAGMVDVTVTTPAGTSAVSSGDQYTYLPPAPRVDSVSPNGGSIAGGTSVTILGRDFVLGGSSVKFGATGSATVQFVSPGKLVATAPAETAGVVDVTVTTPGGTSATSRGDLYAYGPPTITSVSPSSGSAAGGNTVTIKGTNFVPSARVSYGDAPSPSGNFVSPTEIRAVAPPHATGVVDVAVTTPAGASATSPGDQYTYVPAPPSCQAATGSTAEGLAVTVQLRCSDATGAVLSYAIDTNPAHGSLGSINQTTGQVTYTPNTGFVGQDSFTYHASSANGTSSTATLSLTVYPPPACEDTFLTTAEGRAATASLSCVDAAGASLSYAIVNGPSHGTLGLLHQSSGQVSYTPNAGFNGLDSFTYQASSANGKSNTATVSIMVNAPPACQSQSVSTGAGNPVVVPLNCADATGADVTYAVVNGPSHGTLGSISQPTAEVTYTPANGYTGSDSFTYRATSANGTSDPPAIVSITVTASPSCHDVAVRTGEARRLVVHLGCSDAAGAPLSYAIDTYPSHGLLGSIAQSSSQVPYTPDPGYSGSDSFTYHATSTNGTSNTATVQIMVNQAPVCHSVRAGTTEGNTTTVTLSCSDSLGATLTYVIDREPAYGSLGPINQTTAKVAYAPDPALSGWDTFEYHAESVNGASSSQTVSVAVRPLVTLTTPANGLQTNHDKPMFAGAASTGEADSQSVTVKVFTNGAAGHTLVATLQAPTGLLGAWSVASSRALTDGPYAVTAQESDAAGLTGYSASHTFTVDTTAPAVTLTSPANHTSTTNTKPKFAGAAGITPGDKPTITVRIYAGTTATGPPVQTLTATRSGGGWSVAPTIALATGTYTARASQADDASNIGLSSASTFAIS